MIDLRYVALGLSPLAPLPRCLAPVPSLKVSAHEVRLLFEMLNAYYG